MKKLVFTSRVNAAKSTFGALVALPLVCLSGGAAQAQLKGETLPVGPVVSQPQPSPAADATPTAPAAPPKTGATLPTLTPSADTTALPGNRINANLTILLLGLDEVDLLRSANWQPPAVNNKDENGAKDAEAKGAKELSNPTAQLEKQLTPEIQEIGNRDPGHAQMVAAPLRRILAEAGATNVLDAALDGPSLLRTLNAARLSGRVLAEARSATRQIEAELLQKTGEAAEIPAALQQDAITAFTRIGQAMGYRSVVAVVAPPTPVPGAPQAMLLLIDCQEESGQIIPVNVPGQADANQLAAAAGALLLPRLSQWPATSSSKIQAQVDKYLKAAQEAAGKNDLLSAQDYINQVVGLQPNNAKAYETLGDLLQKPAPQAAATAYSRALAITPDNGPLWSKMALTYTLGDNPSWPNALDAAKSALSAGYDSALLRTVMASAEFGRAQIFNKAGRQDQADEATRQAKEYLNAAIKLAPRDSTINAEVSKLIATNLITAQRFAEAASTLDTTARKYPKDVALQRLYAEALSGAEGRTEDAFVAWSTVWKLEEVDAVPLDADRYTKLANGFDKHIFNLARAASMLTSSAANGAIPAATALPQVQQYAALVKDAVDSLRLIHPPAGRLSTRVQVGRLLAGDLFAQAVESYALYLQNGDQEVLSRGGQLHYQAIDRLNSARKAS